MAENCDLKVQVLYNKHGAVFLDRALTVHCIHFVLLSFEWESA